MSSLPLHPMLVHLPIALSLIVPLVAAGTLFAWHRGLLPKRAFAVAALLQVLLVGSGLVALNTGEADEERVERLVPEAALEAHEDAASTFVWAAGAVCLLFLGASVLPDRPAARTAAIAATVGSLAVLGFGIQVGHAGGRLVYEHGAASAYTAAASPSANAMAAPTAANAGDDDD